MPSLSTRIARVIPYFAGSRAGFLVATALLHATGVAFGMLVGRISATQGPLGYRLAGSAGSREVDPEELLDLNWHQQNWRQTCLCHAACQALLIKGPPRKISSGVARIHSSQ